MSYPDVYELHLQVLAMYEKQTKYPLPEQNKINYFKRQMNFFAEDIVQRIFVLNQILNIYESHRLTLVKSCSDQYFSKINMQKD